MIRAEFHNVIAKNSQSISGLLHKFDENTCKMGVEIFLSLAQNGTTELL